MKILIGLICLIAMACNIPQELNTEIVYLKVIRIKGTKVWAKNGPKLYGGNFKTIPDSLRVGTVLKTYRCQDSCGSAFKRIR